MNGHLNILELAVSQGLQLPGTTVLGAIKGRSLECLKFAVEEGRAQVPDCALVYAAAHGYLDGVRYLHRQGFPAHLNIISSETKARQRTY
jgi:hypothetical protein